MGAECGFEESQRGWGEEVEGVERGREEGLTVKR